MPAEQIPGQQVSPKTRLEFNRDISLAALLNDTRVLIHPFIVGELACRNLRNRREVMTLFAGLARITVAADTEVLFFIEQHDLMGRGIGYIDTHLLASVALDSPARLWTYDQRVASVAAGLSIGHS